MLTSTQVDAKAQVSAWLGLVDAADGLGSWKAAGAAFRSAITPEKWSEQLDAARGPIGPLTSRALAVEQHFTELPGEQPGDYLVQQYHAVYGRVRAVVETLTLQREMDGSWRVVGYFIR